MGKKCLPPVLDMFRSIGFAAVVEAMALLGFARDLEGGHKDSPLRDWFDRLASGKGLCCSCADGYVVPDADWESRDGHYRARVPRAANSEQAIWVRCTGGSGEPGSMT